MADERSLALRREILETVYKLEAENPGSQAVWQADRSDPDRLHRMREAEYLRAKGFVAGSIGVDGGLALRITPDGRDHVDAGVGTGTPPIARPPATPLFNDQDLAFMKMAIDEARKSKAEDDRVHPMVGAVVVRDGQLVAKAHRGELEGGEHGEFTVLERKLKDDTLVGATVYVTLEPCTDRNHPKVSCAERLLERKVARVVIGMVDPNPRISGRGITKLRSGRVDVALFPDRLAAEVEELNREFARGTRAGSEASAAPPSPASSQPQSSVRIAIRDSEIGGDVVGGNKNSK